VAEKDDYLLDLLVDLGFTSADVVAKAREEASAAGVGVVDYLVANKVIRPGDVTQAKAAQFGAEVVNLANLKIEDDVIAVIPRDVAKKYRVIPIYKTDTKVGVALADPSDLNAIDSLAHMLGAEIDQKVASEQDIETALNKYYGGEKRRSMEENEAFKDVIQELTLSNVEIVDGGRGGRAADPVGEPDNRRRVQVARLGHPSRTVGEKISSALSHRRHDDGNEVAAEAVAGGDGRAFEDPGGHGDLRASHPAGRTHPEQGRK